MKYKVRITRERERGERWREKQHSWLCIKNRLQFNLANLRHCVLFICSQIWCKKINETVVCSQNAL